MSEFISSARRYVPPVSLENYDIGDACVYPCRGTHTVEYQVRVRERGAGGRSTRLASCPRPEMAHMLVEALHVWAKQKQLKEKQDAQPTAEPDAAADSPEWGDGANVL